LEGQTKYGPITPIREGLGVWVDRNRVSLHNTRKILKKYQNNGENCGKIPEKNENIVGIFWKIPKLKKKIAGRTVGYSHG